MGDWYGKNGVEEEFQEEDMWGGVVNEREDSSPLVKKAQKSQSRHSSSAGSTCSSAWSLNAAPRMNILRAQEAKGLPHHHHEKSSTPLNVPEWSKIYSGRKSNKSWVENDGHGDGENIMHDGGIGRYQECLDDDDDDEEMVPPHEYIARRMARTQISSFSMCEGVGRTLKGRDLSILRNAILTKTGFLE